MRVEKNIFLRRSARYKVACKPSGCYGLSKEMRNTYCESLNGFCETNFRNATFLRYSHLASPSTTEPITKRECPLVRTEHCEQEPRFTRWLRFGKPSSGPAARWRTEVASPRPLPPYVRFISFGGAAAPGQLADQELEYRAPFAEKCLQTFFLSADKLQNQ